MRLDEQMRPFIRLLIQQEVPLSEFQTLARELYAEESIRALRAEGQALCPWRVALATGLSTDEVARGLGRLKWVEPAPAQAEERAAS